MGHKKYADYTEAKADEQFLAFIENDICANMRKSCPAEDRRLRSLSDDSSTCLSGTKDCATQGELYEEAAKGGRRLSDVERAQVSANAEVEVIPKNPEVACPAVDPAHYDMTSVEADATESEATEPAAASLLSPSALLAMVSALLSI